MNENINLCEILKGCPVGTEFYSKVHGNVRLTNVYDSKYPSPIQIEFCNAYGNYVDDSFKIDGKYKDGNGECLLVPSKDQQDWSKWKCPKPKFDPKTLKPFDKVLVIDSDRYWTPVLFDHLEYSLDYPRMYCFDHMARKVIPYNDDTKHLIGTSDEAPEYYRYWED